MCCAKCNNNENIVDWFVMMMNMDIMMNMNIIGSSDTACRTGHVFHFCTAYHDCHNVTKYDSGTFKVPIMILMLKLLHMTCA